MRPYQIVRQALKDLLGNKGRSFLTILGIVIGIGSVIALISLGAGVQSSIGSQVSSLGTTNLTILPGPGFSTSREGSAGGGIGNRSSFTQAASTLTQADLHTLEDQTKHPHIKFTAAAVTGSSIYTANGNQQRKTITGVSPSYAIIYGLNTARGVFISPADLANSKHTIVLGSQFANDIFGSADPIGKTLAVENDSYTVVGVLQSTNESSVANFNDRAFIPYTSAFTTFSTTTFSLMIAQADSEANIDNVKADIQTTLLANHNITNAKLADFSVNSAKDLLATVNQITNLLTSLLAGIAAISLVVGGIGIMNIMLVSVTERTREIGLRKAVGAKTADILGQFITEAIILTLTGGVLGIGLGWLIGIVAARVLGITPIITLSAVLLAVGVSSVVGLIFGIYPAAKAARLNPIDALRYE